MVILQINKFHYLRGGSERYYFNLSKLLESRGHQVIHFSTQGAENVSSPFARFFAERIDLNRLNLTALARLFHNRQAVRALESLLDEERPDIAHLHNIAYHLTPAIITVLKRRGIPVVMTLHDYQLICPNYQLYTGGRPCTRCQGGRYWQCLLHRCAHGSIFKSLLAMLEAYWNRGVNRPYDLVDHFLAPSAYLKMQAATFGLPSEKITVAHNFLDTDGLPTITRSYDTPPYLLYYGRLSPEKGVDLLIRAFAAVSDRVPFDLKIVGSGPELQALEIVVHELGLHDRIAFTGRKQERELWELVANSAAVAMPSRWPENWPYSVLEAQSYGKPVVAAAIGGLPEMVEDGINGFLFPAGDRSALSECIAALPYADLDRLGEAAKRSAARFDPDSHYRAIMEIYENIKQ